MEREHRYWVAKVKDVEKYLTSEQQTTLHMLMTKINVGRLRDDKPVLQAVCVDSDWPEYETVWKMIEARVDGKASSASVPEVSRITIAYTSEDRRFTFVAAKHMADGSTLIIDEHVAFIGAEGRWVINAAAAPTPPVSEDRKDAERWRFFCSIAGSTEPNEHFDGLPTSPTKAKLDAAIDTVMDGK